MQAALKTIRRRPLTSLSAAGVTLVAGTAMVVEARAEQKERWSENNPQVTVAHLPREYDREKIREYWLQRPVTIVKRFGHVAYELAPIAGAFARDFYFSQPDPKMREELHQTHATDLREALTNLGPAWVKGGQQLAIRPDLVPPVVLKELQKLCDSVRPIPDEEAFGVLRNELGQDDLDQVFEGLHLVASASLGQVYKAKLRESGKMVAVKVQRPGMLRSFSLDLFLLQKWGDFMDGFTSIFTKQKPYHRDLFDAFSLGSYSEMDYENEARNQIYFQKELAVRRCQVKVPDVHQEFTTRRVLTSEWINGVKLADASKEKIRELIPVGVELFLTQLLDIGAFHADPHPGNLLVDDAGVFCLLDFGLCAEVDAKSRDAMTKAIVHLLHRDFDSLVTHDTKELGFLPQDFDTSELKPILTKVLTGGLLESGSDMKKRKRKLQEISNELNEIFFQYPFQVPPFFALVTRGLGLLEGIALTGDPEFDIFKASAPYATKRAIAILGTHGLRRVTTMSRRKTKNAVQL